MPDRTALSRRAFLGLAAATTLGQALQPAGAGPVMARRRIPGTAEELPVVGLGTSDEFGRMPPDGGKELRTVLDTLLDYGGTLVDTAPGYGDAERILGTLAAADNATDRLFLSTKVRSRGREAGLHSMRNSVELLGKTPLDLLMVHSLVDADTQLDNLQRFKEDGRVRYIGITTSRRSGFERMESLIDKRELDFIQVNYSPLEPEAAERVIPAARERGVAVMINRAFVNGRYFSRVRGRELPGWTREFDCESWAQLSLKWILGNPDVTCVLAATSNARHMADNAAAGIGGLPDVASRQRIRRWLQDL